MSYGGLDKLVTFGAVRLTEWFVNILKLEFMLASSF